MAKARSYVTSVIEEVRTREQPEELSETELIDILTTKLPNSSNYYVIWIEHNQIDENAGRYVHFSWSTVGNQVSYVIRDFIHNQMFSPNYNRRHDRGWRHVHLDLTAGAIWNTARRKYPIVTRTGLGGIGRATDEAGEIERNREQRERWTIVLDIMTKLMPPDDAGH